MNFDTRYLIRWGIPGWIFIITLGVYFLLERGEKNIYELLSENATDLLAVSAFVLVIGIPIGYILNQLHHVWIWVLKVDHKKYFDLEIEIFRLFLNSERGERIEERYKYLLTRIHELGGIKFALVGALIIMILNFICSLLHKDFNLLSLIYIGVNIFVCYFIKLSRDYFQKNLEAFINAYGFSYDHIYKD